MAKQDEQLRVTESKRGEPGIDASQDVPIQTDSSSSSEFEIERILAATRAFKLVSSHSHALDSQAIPLRIIVKQFPRILHGLPHTSREAIRLFFGFNDEYCYTPAEIARIFKIPVAELLSELGTAMTAIADSLPDIETRYADELGEVVVRCKRRQSILLNSDVVAWLRKHLELVYSPSDLEEVFVWTTTRRHVDADQQQTPSPLPTIDEACETLLHGKLDGKHLATVVQVLVKALTAEPAASQWLQERFPDECQSIAAAFNADEKYQQMLDTTDPLVLGERLREYRQSKQLTLQQLAENAQTYVANVSEHERGVHRPRLEAIKAYAAALGISPEELLAPTLTAAIVAGGVRSAFFLFRKPSEA